MIHLLSFLIQIQNFHLNYCPSHSTQLNFGGYYEKTITLTDISFPQFNI